MPPRPRRHLHHLLQLLAHLVGGHADRSFDARIRKLANPAVLICDDFAMREFTAAQADDLYELLTERVGRPGRSLILTSNRSPSDWYPLFPNATVGESILDREDKVGGSSPPHMNRSLVEPTTVVSVLVSIHPGPAPFTGGHPDDVRARHERSGTPLNAGQHCWKACKGQTFRSSNLLSSAMLTC